jgi:UDP-N-acetylglucosamine 2-epimerase (non-hydrolysing)
VTRRSVMTVYGTRPEAIKLALVIHALRDREDLRAVTVVTGQHREMMDEVNETFGISPEVDLDIMQHGQDLSDITERVLHGLGPVLEAERPDVVIVQGDTTTSSAAALSAAYHRIPVVHVEAGLRSHDSSSPFPEEINRVLTSHLAALHLTPTALARNNLLREGVHDADIVVTGNTVIDALMHARAKAVRFQNARLEELCSSDRRIVVVTMHRRESWGRPMEAIATCLAELCSREPDVVVVIPAHRNPVVRQSLLPPLEDLPNVVVTEPLPYAEFARLLGEAHLVLTDSGGIQEEAPSLGTPVIVLRETTERPEAIEAGTALLVGSDPARILKEVTELLHQPERYAAMANAVNPYGDGHASERVVAAVGAMLGRGTRMAEFAP